jgi:polyhydroxyalkanoate synthase
MGEPKINVDVILSKLADDTEKAHARATKASDILLEKLDTTIAATPYEVIHQVDRVKLKHYKTEVRFKTPLLVVYALINRETMLDLQPGRSVVERFLKAGINLYMIDWGYPQRKDRFLTIDDHVNGYMDEMVDFIREKHGIDQINLMGICMGGTFSVMYSALHPEKIKNLVTTVSPTNFHTKEGLLHIWMQDTDVDRLVDSFGNMPGDLMNFGFLLLNPARLMIDKYVGFVENMDSKEFIENFIRMEKWIFDSPDVPGETFRQFIKDCYQTNKLINNQMQLNGKRVDLNNLTMPLLNIYGNFDHLVPPGACNLLTSRVGSKDVEDLCLMTGHIGIYVSSKTQREFTPKIISWLAARDQESSDKTPKNTRSSRKTKRTDPSNAKKEINKT